MIPSRIIVRTALDPRKFSLDSENPAIEANTTVRTVVRTEVMALAR